MRIFKKEFNREIINIIILFFIWRIGLFCVAYFSNFNLPYMTKLTIPTDLPHIISVWLPYDAGWYLRIAHEGYGFSHQAMAFFPFWPLIIHIFSKIFFFADYRIIGFFIANISTLLACIVFYLLVKIDYDKKIAYRATKYFLFFPMSVFLATTYTESIFILLILLSFYLIKRKQVFFSGLAAIAASATRLVGSFLFIPLIIEIMQQKEVQFKWLKILFILITPIGLLGYMIYLKTTTNDYLGFLHAYQNSTWDKNLNFLALQQFGQNIFNLISFKFVHGGHDINLFLSAGYLIFALILIFNYKKIKLSYLIYGLFFMLIPLFSGSLTSLNRYLLPIFPFFIILGIYGKYQWLDELITILSLLLLGLFTTLFVNGYWVG